VLVEEVLVALRPQPGDVVADCTIGYGGHAMEFIKRIGPTGRLIGFDVDAAQLARTAKRLEESASQSHAHGQFSLHRSHFAGLGKSLAAERLDGYDIIFADLGVSSIQIDDPSRGFSYKHDGPLDMRMDDRLVRTAADLIASLSIEELSHCLKELADEPDHARIAQCIARQRALKPVERTRQLVQLVLEAKGLSQREWRERPSEQRGQLHPAARTFQTLRMLVNDEVGGLEQLLRVAPHCLRPGGRIGVISFHSGEHRRIEDSFCDGLRLGSYAAIAEAPVRPSPGETARNPRSRSARLRWAATRTAAR
jgi:16S rRNA (cytosine1402-N4)-methyltransferase